MRRVRLALADGDSAYLKRNADKLSRIDGIQMVVATMDGEELIRHVAKEDIDVVVTGLMLKRLDGLAVLETMNHMDGNAPKSIVVSHMNSESVVCAAMKCGASYYLLKPVRAELLYERIKMVSGEEAGEEDGRDHANGDIRKRISAIMKQMGIAAVMQGYRCLETALLLRHENEEAYGRLTGQLYPKVAEINGISAANVERSIRTAIAGAWNSGAIQRFALDKNDALLLRGKPTAGQMIEKLSMYIRDLPSRAN